MNVGGLNPSDATELFDSIVFDGRRSPGVVTLTGFDREQSIDVQESDGQKGASTKWKGEKCGSGTLTFAIVRNDDRNEFAEWDEYAELFWSTIPPKSGDKPVAKDIYHPDLARNHYTSIILRKMGKIVHDGKGGATIAVEVAEYYPPKPAKVGGATGSKPKSGGGAADPNDPVAAATQELNDLLKAASSP